MTESRKQRANSQGDSFVRNKASQVGRKDMGPPCSLRETYKVKLTASTKKKSF